MSTFTLNSITVQGLNVIAKLVAGSTLQFTRIAVGDGAMPSDKTPLTVTDLTNKLFDVDINSVENNGNGSATVTGIFSNADRETGFFYRELGLFAKEPDTQAEFLYCYGNAGADAEWISPSGASSVIEKEVKIVTLIGNAETVTAEIKSGIYAAKEEVEAALAVKADLDATAEEGGRVLASQMRFDDTQILYVDAAAAEGGDGSEAKPFKTIQAAINARYKGAAVIYVRIKAGTYAESISVPRSPGTTWRFIREGTGTVNINNAIVDNCTYVYFDNLTFNGPAGDNSTIIYVANTPAFNFNAVTINGASNATGVNFSTSRGIMRNSSINNCGLAIAATDGAYIDLKSNGGTGNTRAYQADGSVIICDYYVPEATTPYEKVNGGVISVQGGTSAFPSNYSQLYNLGDFSDAQALKTAILTEFGGLGIGESRACWFANNITGGFGIFETGQRMQCTIIKSTNNGSGYGTVIFYSHHNAAMAYMQVQDGAFAQATPVKFISSNDLATTQSPGVVTLADEMAVLSETDEAAVHVPLMYEINDFRRMNKAYSVGDKVNCAFKHELFLECTQAGTTSNSTLDTRNVTHGQVITDGTAQWTVRTHIKSVNGVVADAAGNVAIEIPEPVIASEAEAKAGTNNTKHMTPLRVAQAIDALDGNPITGASISGKTITLTKKDGSKITLNTQDTNTSNWSISKGTNGWARDNSTGFTIQWLTVNASSATFPRTFTTVYGAVAVSKNRNNTTLGVGAAMVTALSTTKVTVCQAIMSDEQYNRVNTQNLNGYVLAYGIS
nr:MAG TPA: tail-collar fiber protein [Caudoviricetes sp.]